MQGNLIEGLNKENEIQVKFYEINNYQDDSNVKELVSELDKRLNDVIDVETNYGKAKSFRHYLLKRTAATKVQNEAAN